MWIVLQIEQSEYHAFSDSLRASGIIIEAPIDQGKHHTHSIEMHSEIQLTWNEIIPIEDRELLKKSADIGAKAKVLLIVVETDEIQLLKSLQMDSKRVLNSILEVVEKEKEIVHLLQILSSNKLQRKLC